MSAANEKAVEQTGSAGRVGSGRLKTLIPVMATFFVMGFVDLIGTATNYVKVEFSLTDSIANLFTVMVFFWFLIFSVPTSMLMNRIGRRNTVLLSIVVTVGAMVLPVLAYVACPGGSTQRLVLIVASFALLGIGNTLMQVSLNPLLTLFVKGDGLASTLTAGQFIKTFASVFGPIIAGWGMSRFGSWWLLYAIYAVVGVLVGVLLFFDKIEEEPARSGKTGIVECFKLLGNRAVLLCFIGIICHVGIDVCVNAQSPRILMEHTNVPLTVAAGAASVFFAFRLIGCFTGSLVLSRISNRMGLLICGGLMVVASLGLAAFSLVSSNPPQWLFYVCVAAIGFGNSNVFSLFLSNALLDQPDRQNEVSGLMMMGLIGGAILPSIMGVASDAMGQFGGVLVVLAAAVYVLVIAIFHKAIESK